MYLAVTGLTECGVWFLLGLAVMVVVVLGLASIWMTRRARPTQPWRRRR